jgi:hypothetical protein
MDLICIHLWLLRRLRKLVDEGCTIHPSRASQRDLVVDRTHDLVDLEASQCNHLLQRTTLAPLLDTIKAVAQMWDEVGARGAR